MQWFKHDTDCDESEGLSMLIEKYGWEGYGRWFRILEIIAKKMDKTDRCSASYPAAKWQKMLGIYHRRSLEDWLQSLVNLCSISVECQEDVITIYVPNLLKKRDTYSKRFEHCSNKVPPKNKEVRSKNIYIPENPESEPVLSDKKPPPEPKAKHDDIPYSEIISDLNTVCGKSYRVSSGGTKEKIAARWHEGFRLEDFKKVHRNQASRWLKDPQYNAYLRPETLYGTKFDSYLNSSEVKKEQVLL